MNAAAPLRVGWCPGALRPMLAGDGLLVRIKPRGGRLAARTCVALADLARRFGNGLFDITGRANLQLRGIGHEHLPALTDALAGLGLLDATPDGEAVRNVVSAPLAGADASALLDIRPVVAELERRLADDPALWRLPPKFAWGIDDGGSLGLDGIPADVGFKAVRNAGKPVFAVSLDGAGQFRAGGCAPERLPDAALALATAFLDLNREAGLAPRRMRDLTAVLGVDAILSRAGLSRLDAAEGGEGSAVPRGSPPPIGLFRRGDLSWIGVAPPFGRLEAETLGGLAELADRAGVSELRLTPWRTIVAAGLPATAAEWLWTAVVASAGPPPTAARLITDAADPRLAVAACSGAPACMRATTAVQQDAARLAAQLRPASAAGGITLHVSGCAKGCARPRPTAWTLVGRDGLYDLVHDGKAGDTPERSGLSPDAVAAMLTLLVRAVATGGPSDFSDEPRR